jgi:TFIIF-interacting CTD phosphatase-like protein
MDDESHFKDLDKVGRDLARTIIVDNMPHNFKYNKNNGLFIKSWKDDPNDNQLLGLCRLLKQIAIRKPDDVRPIINVIRNELDKETIKSVDNPYDLIDLDKLPL